METRKKQQPADLLKEADYLLWALLEGCEDAGTLGEDLHDDDVANFGTLCWCILAAGLETMALRLEDEMNDETGAKLAAWCAAKRGDQK